MAAFSTNSTRVHTVHWVIHFKVYNEASQMQACNTKRHSPEVTPLYLASSYWLSTLNPLTLNDPYKGRTAPITPKRFILYIY